MSMRERFWTWLAGVSMRRSPGRLEELGAPGLDIYSGMIQYRSLSELDRYERIAAFEKMRHHIIIAACRRIIIGQLKNALWMVDPFTEEKGGEPTPYDQQVADMVAEWIFEMPETRWSDFIAQAGEGLFMGSAIFEKVFEPIASGGVVPRKLGPRSLRSVYQYLVGPHGEFEGIWQRTEGDAAVDVMIPAEKLILMTFGGLEGNFEGEGLYLDMYDSWNHIEQLTEIYKTAMMRMGSGVLTLHHSGSLAEERIKQWQNVGDSWVKGKLAWLLLPKELQVDVTPLNEPETILDALQHHKRNIYEVANVEHLDLGSSATGSFALAKVQMDSFLMSLEDAASVIRDSVQASLIEPLVDYNFPDGTPYPQLRFQMAKQSAAQLGETLDSFTSAGLVLPLPEVIKQVHEELGLSVEGIDEYLEEKKAARPTFEPSDDDEEEDDDDSMDASEVRLAAEYRNDPTRDGTGGWRRPTALERRYELIQFNDTWDDWVAEMAKRLTKGSDELVYGLIDKVRRYLLANNAADAIAVDFTEAGLERLRKQIVAAVRAIAEGAAQHFYERSGLGDAPAFTAKELAIMKTLTVKRLTKYMDNAKGTLFQRLDTNMALLDALSRGEATQQTVESFISRSRLTYEQYRDRYIVMEGKAIVNNGVHLSQQAMVRDPRVLKVQRSGLLDNRICSNCESLDGIIVDKSDAFRIAPSHGCKGGALCRCVLIGILETESPQFPSVPPNQLPRLEDTAFGGRRIQIQNIGRRGILEAG